VARQGKFHSSPFHIENWAYKYAVEHENGDFAVPHEVIQCENRVNSTNGCKLWNSGLQTCMPHKCPVLNGVQCSRECGQCAYYYSECKHPKRPIRGKIIGTEASYCAFYIGQDDKKRFQAIRRTIIRLDYTNELDTLKKRLKKRAKYIRECEKELLTCDMQSSDYLYLKDKIVEKQRINKNAEQRIAFLEKQLAKMGGPLNKTSLGKKKQSR